MSSVSNNNGNKAEIKKFKKKERREDIVKGYEDGLTQCKISRRFRVPFGPVKTVVRN